MFTTFSKAVHQRFVELSNNELYQTDAGEGLFEAYLEMFPEGTNPIYRTRRVYDCQCCKGFIRRLGSLVGVKDNQVLTVWDVQGLPEPFQSIADRLGELVKSGKITGVFRTKEWGYGKEYNYDNVTNERHDHFYGEVARRHFTPTPEAVIGEKNTIMGVMKRGLEQINHVDLVTVLELINENGLYRGEEHRAAVQGFQGIKMAFHEAGNKELFIWENLGHRNSLFRNSVIGTLLVDLAEGKELDEAVRAFEVKVAPMNYKRPTTVITQGMVENAVKAITDLGLHGALARRYAKIGDISVRDVLFVDNAVSGKMKGGIEELLKGEVVKGKMDTRAATTRTSEEFVESVLPGARSLEVLVENRHVGNFVSLTGGDGAERIFRWGNNFAWSYDGNVTDSVKQRVKAAGGRIDAKLRVSLSWFNTDDLDLHARTPTGDHIAFNNKLGILDVDMNAGQALTRTPVENLAWQRLDNGVYTIFVHQFRQRESGDTGFAIEIEYGGMIHQYSYPRAVKGEVDCFKLHISGGRLEKIESSLEGGNQGMEKWGVKTETLVPVSLVCYSPNYWEHERVGAKHLIFALEGCRNPGSTRGIYNEFLRGDLEKHRKVFEVLGNKTQCPFSEEQVSGVGFTSARGDTVTVVVDGKRSYTLTF